MANKSDNIFDEIGVAVLAFFAGAAILAFFLIGLLAFPIVIGLWLLWKYWRFNPAARAKREVAELKELHASVRYLADQIDIPDVDVLAETAIGLVDENLEDGRKVPEFLHLPIRDATQAVLARSGLEPLPEFDATALRHSVDARNDLREKLYRLQSVYHSGEAGIDAVFNYLCNSIATITASLPAGDTLDAVPNDSDLTVELIDMLPDPKGLAEALLYLPFEWDAATIKPLQDAALMRMAAITGKRVDDLLKNPQRLPKPTEAKGAGRDVLREYLRDSPFLLLLSGKIAYRIPAEARFEHMHILAGTGHGKTQLIQRFVREDLSTIYFHHKLSQTGGLDTNAFPPRSLVVIDGQGEMIDAISRRSSCAPDDALADKVLIIDPTDTRFPLALNMFDIGQDELEELDPVAREMVFNGTVELYVYLFGALLSAELTQKQDVLFRYLARLMLVIPNATLNTLRDVIENGEKYHQHIAKLDHQSQEFFRTQF